MGRFVLCGDPAMAEADKHGTIKGDIFGSPDGLWFDARGVLWIQTDISTSALNKATMPIWATTRCWRRIPPLARSAAF